MNKEISIVAIADIHFGAMDSDELYKELDKVLFDFLKGLKELSLIVIAGDFFDHILYLNEVPANRSCIFMDRLVYYAKRLNSKIRIVYGTESHECNQYSIFFDKYMDELDFKVIKHVCDEELFDDLNVLYLPEEYIYNKDDYYRGYLNNDNKYDYVFGHGTIQEVMTHVKRSSGTSNRAKVPVFTSKELESSCKGEVYFGHYHINSNIDDKVFYIGSFSRWCYGEEDSKGFYYLTHKGKKYTHEFIENTYAPKYTTISYGYDNKIFTSKDKLNDEITRLVNLNNNGLIDNIRLNLNIPDTYEDPEGLITLVGERFKDNPNFKIKVTNGYIEKKQKVNDEYLQETIKKYAFIFDKNMPISEQAHQFILTKYEKDIPSDRIELHLTKDINEVE